MVFARVADCNSDRAAVPVENAKGLIDPLNCKKTARKQTNKQNENFKRQRKNLLQTTNYIKCMYTMYVQ